ncbi:MAG: CHRD domain-containing protein [Acidobacteriota bacterium]
MSDVKRSLLLCMLLVSFLVIPQVRVVSAQDGEDEPERERRGLVASLNGFQEVPAVVSSGRGSFRARVRSDRTEIHYRLRYGRLEGEVTQAHIHIGQRGVNGGIAVLLCSNEDNSPAQACPMGEGEISGTVIAADILPISEQGVEGDEMVDLLRAIRAGAAYVNVHSSLFLDGEIRGQIRWLSRTDR